MKKRRPPSHQLVKNKQDMMTSLLSDDRYYQTMPKTSLRLPVAQRYAQFGSVQEEIKAEINGEKKALQKKQDYAKSQLKEIMEDLEKPQENRAIETGTENSTIHVKIQ